MSVFTGAPASAQLARRGKPGGGAHAAKLSGSNDRQILSGNLLRVVRQVLHHELVTSMSHDLDLRTRQLTISHRQ
jgi:hypothetical protein